MPVPLIDITGQRFGCVTVIERAPDVIYKRAGRRARWHCRCDCGTIFISQRSALKRANSCRSCSQILDLTGHVYGRLTVIRRDSTRTGRSWWFCQCECGNTKTLTGNVLRSGNTTSCGCYLKQRITETHRKHGASHTREFYVWQGMKARCYNPKHKDYHRYGGRGIRVCDTWTQSYEQFREDVGYPPSPVHSIDRINNDGNYEPGNVRWATPKEQAENSSKVKRVEVS